MSRFGELEVKGDTIKKFSEKPQSSDGLINGGFFIFKKQILDYLDNRDDCDLEYGALEELAKKNDRNTYMLNPSTPQPLNNSISLASARAGNVIGGGDWGTDRLLPDCIRALLRGEKILIRNPRAIRPWQHVLDPLCGYLLLIQRMLEDGPRFADAWNFGPGENDSAPVERVVKALCEKWGNPGAYIVDNSPHPHEAQYLRLDCSRARSELGWKPRWGLEKAIDATIEWARAYKGGADVKDVCLRQIEEYAAT